MDYLIRLLPASKKFDLLKASAESSQMSDGINVVGKLNKL